MDKEIIDAIVSAIKEDVESRFDALAKSFDARLDAFTAELSTVAKSATSVTSEYAENGRVIVTLKSDMEALLKSVADFEADVRKTAETLATEAASAVYARHEEETAAKFDAWAEKTEARALEAIESGVGAAAETIKDGADGADGVGLSDIVKTEDGHKLVFSDGREVEVKDGARGADGVGVKSVTRGATDAGVLITLTNGETEVILDGRPGSPGKDGRGIEKVENIELGKRLTLTDGEVIDFYDGVDGEAGADGVGISDVVLQDDGATVHLSSGATFKVKHGLPGEPGKDGVGLAGAFIDREGSLTVTLTNGDVKSLGRIDGKDGEDGKDGVDGLGFDELSVEYDGERTVEFKMVRGDVAKSFPVHMPIPVYRGFYKPGAFEKGDQVTYAGGIWTALKATAGKPDGGDWEMSVRKGRDGVSVKGDPGERGPKGENGRDLTQVGSDGRKW